MATGLGDLKEEKRERKNEWIRVDAKEKLMRFKLRNAKEATLKRRHGGGPGGGLPCGAS